MWPTGASHQCNDERCAICSGKLSIGDFIAQITRTIEEGRIGTIGNTTPPYLAYTYGRYYHGLPELAIVGHKDSDGILRAADEVRSPGRYVLNGCPVIAVPALADKLVIAHRLAGDDITALQLLWPDQEGRWPWDPEYAGSSQPLLGEADVNLHSTDHRRRGADPGGRFVQADVEGRRAQRGDDHLGAEGG